MNLLIGEKTLNLCSNNVLKILNVGTMASTYKNI